MAITLNPSSIVAAPGTTTGIHVVADVNLKKSDLRVTANGVDTNDFKMVFGKAKETIVTVATDTPGPIEIELFSKASGASLGKATLDVTAAVTNTILTSLTPIESDQYKAQDVTVVGEHIKGDDKAKLTAPSGTVKTIPLTKIDDQHAMFSMPKVLRNVAGTYKISIISADGSETPALDYEVKPGTFEINDVTLPDAEVGKAYTGVQFTKVGGPYSIAGVTWSATGLPAGMTMSGSGKLSGTPTTPFDGDITVKVDAEGVIAERKFNLKVAPKATAPMKINARTLTPAEVGKDYTAVSFNKTGGPAGTASWSATGLPAGMTLTTDGKLQGKPTADGDFNVDVKVTVGTESATETFPLKVNKAAPVLTPLAITTQPANAAKNVGETAEFKTVAAGGTAPYTYEWLRNGTPIVGATNQAYKTSALALTDNAVKYSVKVKDSAGAEVTSSEATLTVNKLTTHAPATNKTAWDTIRWVLLAIAVLLVCIGLGMVAVTVSRMANNADDPAEVTMEELAEQNTSLETELAAAEAEAEGEVATEEPDADGTQEPDVNPTEEPDETGKEVAAADGTDGGTTDSSRMSWVAFKTAVENDEIVDPYVLIDWLDQQPQKIDHPVGDWTVNCDGSASVVWTGWYEDDSSIDGVTPYLVDGLTGVWIVEDGIEIPTPGGEICLDGWDGDAESIAPEFNEDAVDVSATSCVDAATAHAIIDVWKGVNPDAVFSNLDSLVDNLPDARLRASGPGNVEVTANQALIWTRPNAVPSGAMLLLQSNGKGLFLATESGTLEVTHAFSGVALCDAFDGEESSTPDDEKVAEENGEDDEQLATDLTCAPQTDLIAVISNNKDTEQLYSELDDMGVAMEAGTINAIHLQTLIWTEADVEGDVVLLDQTDDMKLYLAASDGEVTVNGNFRVATSCDKINPSRDFEWWAN